MTISYAFIQITRIDKKFLINLTKSPKYHGIINPIKSHQIRIIHVKMELNLKYIHIYLVFMELMNHIHQLLDQQLAPKAVVNLDPFRRMLVHINEIRSSNMHFWICAYGGNLHPWSGVSLYAEEEAPAEMSMEQDEKFYFSKIAGFGMFYALYISLSNVHL